MVESRAAVAVQAGKPLEVTTIQVEGPREGEVMIEMRATGVVPHRRLHPLRSRP